MLEHECPCVFTDEDISTHLHVAISDKCIPDAHSHSWEFCSFSLKLPHEDYHFYWKEPEFMHKLMTELYKVSST